MMPSVLLAVVTTASLAAVAGGQSAFIDRADLAKVAHVGQPSGGEVKVIANGKPMAVVTVAKPSAADLSAATFVATSLEEMCGGKAKVVKSNRKLDVPAIYVGSAFPFLKDLGLSAEGLSVAEFSVKTVDGSVYLFGNDDRKRASDGSAYAAYDFAERILGVRQYFGVKDGGRSVVKTSDLTIPALDYGDRPVFLKRDIYPYEKGRAAWVNYENWRIADNSENILMVHCPRWSKDYKKTDPDIFQQEESGVTRTEMLCYSNPKTLKLHLERLEEELKGGRKCGFLRGKAVTVSPEDCGYSCHCKACRELLDYTQPPSGQASKVICAFVRKLSDALAKTHPELVIVYLPYNNYVDIPEGLEFPAGNVEVQLCTMPGFAMMKEASVRAHEEKLITDWAKVTGRKVQNWHYICWPASYTVSPHLFGKLIVDHYRKMREYVSGSFVNGRFPEKRLFLSAYVWLRALWNPDFDCEAVYRVFCERMYGPAAEPMRRVLQIQEDGWSRQWKTAKVSPKNVYGVSWPRAEVEEMVRSFDRAAELAAGDETVLKRIAYFREGCEEFFKESKEFAEGSAFAPLMVQKVPGNPVIDGKLDDPQWAMADALPFVRARDRKVKEPKYPTEVKAVWTPDGITFGFRMTEPTPGLLCTNMPPGNWHNDNIEIFFDVTGEGVGDCFQIILDARDEGLAGMTSMGENTSEHNYNRWSTEGLRSKVWRGADFWSAELFVPFERFRGIKGAQLPKFGAGNLFWLGNFMRHRKCDGYLKEGKTPGSEPEQQRLNTRYSDKSRDQSAFGVFKFKE